MTRTSPKLGDLNAAQREARIRVIASLAQLGFDVVDPVIPSPDHKSHDDVNLALRTLQAMGKLPPGVPDCFGELALDGTIRPVRGLFARLMTYIETLGSPSPVIVIPAAQSAEGAHAGRSTGRVFRVASRLGEILDFCYGTHDLPTTTGPKWTPETVLDPSEAPEKVQSLARRMAQYMRIMVIASPGSGTLLAARLVLASVPPITHAEAIIVSMIQSRAGLLDMGQGMARARPFRAPHRTVSEAAMVGKQDRPGEVELATYGVLLLDEIHEFRKGVLDAIRPAPGRDMRIIGLAPPCPCGRSGSTMQNAGLACRCPIPAQQRYRARLAEIAKMFEMTVIDVNREAAGSP
jgi:magnesium chelatase family protein